MRVRAEDMDVEMRRGDLMPDLVIDLTDEGLPIPLAAATVVNVIGSRNGTLLFKRPGTIEADGVVSMAWQATDTAVPGTIVVEAEIEWPGARPQTIRASNHVKVLPDLG